MKKKDKKRKGDTVQVAFRHEPNRFRKKVLAKICRYGKCVTVINVESMGIAGYVLEVYASLSGPAVGMLPI